MESHKLINLIGQALSTIQSIKLVTNSHGFLIDDKLYIHCYTDSQKKPCLNDIQAFIKLKNTMPGVFSIYVSKMDLTEPAKTLLNDNYCVNIQNSKSFVELKNSLIAYLHFNFNLFSYEEDGSAIMLLS